MTALLRNTEPLRNAGGQHRARAGRAGWPGSTAAPARPASSSPVPRLHDAPALEDDGVQIAAVPDHLAGEVERLSERLAERSLGHVYVVLARSAPDEHGVVSDGLWVAVFKKSTPLDRLDAVWAAIDEADLWPPVRLVVANDLRFPKADVFLRAGTRVGLPQVHRVAVRPLTWRESWLVTLGTAVFALPYAVSKQVNAPHRASRSCTWATVVLEAMLLFFVLRWALGRRADGEPITAGRPSVPALAWVGVAIFGGAAAWGLLRHPG